MKKIMLILCVGLFFVGAAFSAPEKYTTENVLIGYKTVIISYMNAMDRSKVIDFINSRESKQSWSYSIRYVKNYHTYGE